VDVHCKLPDRKIPSKQIKKITGIAKRVQTKKANTAMVVCLITPTEVDHFPVLEVDPARDTIRARDDILELVRDNRVVLNLVVLTRGRQHCLKVKRTTKSLTVFEKID
jgi:hypothetical protein